MTKGVLRTYIAVCLALTALLIYYCVRYRVIMEPALPETGQELLQVKGTDNQKGTTIRNDSWSGMLHVDGITGKYCHLIFYTIHLNVEVYHGAECIYSMGPSSRKAISKTPGCVWNDVLLTEDLNGEDIRVKLTPVYPDLSFGVPDFYLGEKGEIVKQYLRKELGTVIVSLMLIIVGCTMMIYVFYNRKNSEVDKDLALLGWLAALVGIWRASDTALMKMPVNGLPVFSLIPFIAMMLCVVPFVTFMMNLYSTREFKIWYVPCWISLGITGLGLFLQFFSLADFRQILILIQASILIAIVVILCMAVHELKRSGWNAKLRSNLLGMTLVTLGVAIDLVSYYLTDGKKITPFVIVGFLLYSIALGISVFRESGKLIDAGRGAQSMENLAYHDKLTGLYNRAAFIVDTDPYAVRPENYSVVVLDLNNLKYCNDHLGHEMGDKYIKDSAEIIKNTFGVIGDCYRMGGDEFYCLIPEGGMAACAERQKMMEATIEEYNKASKDIQIGIACGFARYDNRIDYDLNATAKRADQLMYQNKEKMKNHRV